MAIKNYCIVDKDGCYKTYVMTSENGEASSFLNYDLKKGESIVDALPPAQPFLKNKWAGNEWIIDMTPEEQAQAEKEYYQSLGIEYPFKDSAPFMDSYTETLYIALDEVFQMNIDLMSMIMIQQEQIDLLSK